MVNYLKDSNFPYALGVANALREKGVNTDINLASRNLGNQLAYANSIKVPYAVIIGDSEEKARQDKAEEPLHRGGEDDQHRGGGREHNGAMSMAKSDVDRVTEEAMAKGGILVKMYFDMRHNERDKLQPLMTDLINERLMKEKGIVYCYGAIEEPLERDGIFITSGTVTVLFDSFLPLIGIAFSYAPAGIEILKPTKDISFKPMQLQSMLMDISNISINYSKYILERVLSPEEKEAIATHLNDRVELGKKLLGGSKKEEKK